MSDRMQLLEDEMKVMKNEVKQILLDILERMLTNYQNAFPRAETTPSRAANASAPKQKQEAAPQAAVPEVAAPEAAALAEAADKLGWAADEEYRPFTGGREKDGSEKGKTDLLTVATLSQWLTHSIGKVGKERMQTIIDVYEMMGGITPPLKHILLRLIDLDDSTEPAGKPTIKDSVAVLVELDNLFWRARTNRAEAAILSTMLDGKDAVHR